MRGMDDETLTLTVGARAAVRAERSILASAGAAAAARPSGCPRGAMRRAGGHRGAGSRGEGWRRQKHLLDRTRTCGGRLGISLAGGAVPLAGDVADVYLKANLRNLRPLRKEPGGLYIEAADAADRR